MDKIMRRVISGFVFLSALIFVSAQAVEACSCMSSGAACEFFWKTDVVFSGQVAEIKETSRAKIGDSTGFEYPKKLVRLTVGEAFRGSGRLSDERQSSRRNVGF